MESDDDRESEDARYMAMREAQKRRNGVLMSEDEAFKFFVRGPCGILKDHSNMAHEVAKMQLYFCQRALLDLYVDCGYESRLDDDEKFSEGFKAGVKAAMERIKGG